jgi:hypothetical protein
MAGTKQRQDRFADLKAKQAERKKQFGGGAKPGPEPPKRTENERPVEPPAKKPVEKKTPKEEPVQGPDEPAEAQEGPAGDATMDVGPRRPAPQAPSEPTTDLSSSALEPVAGDELPGPDDLPAMPPPRRVAPPRVAQPRDDLPAMPPPRPDPAGFGEVLRPAEPDDALGLPGPLEPSLGMPPLGAEPGLGEPGGPSGWDVPEPAAAALGGTPQTSAPVAEPEKKTYTRNVDTTQQGSVTNLASEVDVTFGMATGNAKWLTIKASRSEENVQVIPGVPPTVVTAQTAYGPVEITLTNKDGQVTALITGGKTKAGRAAEGTGQFVSNLRYYVPEITMVAFTVGPLVPLWNLLPDQMKVPGTVIYGVVQTALTVFGFVKQRQLRRAGEAQEAVKQ